MVLIVDHRSRLPEQILDCLQLRHVKQIWSELLCSIKADCNTELPCTPIDGICYVSLVTNFRLCSRAVAAKGPSMTGTTIPLLRATAVNKPQRVADVNPHEVPLSQNKLVG